MAGVQGGAVRLEQRGLCAVGVWGGEHSTKTKAIDLILTRPFSKLLVFRDCNITSGRFATASQLRWKTLQIKMDSLLRKTPKKIGWRDCASSLEVNELHWVAG